MRSTLRGGIVLCLLHLPAILPAQTAAPGFSCPDTVRAALGGLFGEWEVTALFRTGPGSWDSTAARASFTPDLAGCVVRQEYHGRRYGERYDYLALWGANGDAPGRIQRFFVHSLHGIFGLAAGGFQGDTLLLEQRLTVQGRPLLQQSRFSRPTAEGFTQEDRRSTDDGVSWTVTLQARYRPRPR